MGKQNRNWRTCRRPVLAAVTVFLILAVLPVGSKEPPAKSQLSPEALRKARALGEALRRKPWVEPLPDVRVEMTRPFVKESDLGPESAYKLLLEAIKLPKDPEAADGAPRVWRTGWKDALDKLSVHPWPQEPPPLALKALPADDSALAPKAPWTREQYEDILRRIDLYRPNVAMLDKALAAPNPQVPTAGSPDFPLPYLSGARDLACLLSISAQYRAATGDYAGCQRDLERAVAAGNLVSRGGCLIGHLVGMACDVIAVRAARHICRHYRPSVADQKALARSFLHHEDDVEPFVEAMRAEALLAGSAVEMVYRQANLDPFNRPQPAAPPEGWQKVGFAALMLAGSDEQTTKRNIEMCYRHLVAIATKPYSAAAQSEYDTFFGGLLRPDHGPLKRVLRAHDPVGLILAGMLLPALDHAHVKHAIRAASLRGMALFCAIKAYEKKHGALPDRLDQLVPDYLPRVPKDPFDSKPFRYLKGNVPGLVPKAWAVYSIGKDFADDGGTATSVGNPRNGPTSNPDLVWPSQAYPKAEPAADDE